MHAESDITKVPIFGGAVAEMAAMERNRNISVCML